MSPQPLSRGRSVRMMLYGIPGAGKTRLIGTGPRTLILRPPTDHTDSIELPADVQEEELEDWESVWNNYQWGQQGGFNDYDWVWLDSISLFFDHGMDDVFADAVARKPDRKNYGWDQGEYGINMSRLSKWVRDMVGLSKSMGFNFGITAHPFEWYDPVAQEDVWAPFIQGKNMSPKICGYMNIVAYLQEVRRKGEENKRQLMVDSEGFVGKDQLGCFPELKSGRHGFINPTMDDLIGAINKAKGATAPKPKTTTTRKTAKRRSAKKRS